MVAELESGGLNTLPVWLESETRSNLTVLESDPRRMTKLNETGPHIPDTAASKLLVLVQELTTDGTRWVLSGSMPPGLPSDYYASLLSVIHDAGGKCYLDASGVPLMETLSLKPDVIRINREEAEGVLQQSLEFDRDVVDALHKMAAFGSKEVFISDGGKGAWLGIEDGWYRAAAPQVRVRNTVGAGDAMLAALMKAEMDGASVEEMLQFGVAAGSASCELAGTAAVTMERTMELVEEVGVSGGKY